MGSAGPGVALGGNASSCTVAGKVQCDYLPVERHTCVHLYTSSQSGTDSTLIKGTQPLPLLSLHLPGLLRSLGLL